MSVACVEKADAQSHKSVKLSEFLTNLNIANHWHLSMGSKVVYSFSSHASKVLRRDSLRFSLGMLKSALQF
jgi:hypothetical protein